MTTLDLPLYSPKDLPKDRQHVLALRKTLWHFQLATREEFTKLGPRWHFCWMDVPTVRDCRAGHLSEPTAPPMRVLTVNLNPASEPPPGQATMLLCLPRGERFATMEGASKIREHPTSYNWWADLPLNLEAPKWGEILIEPLSRKRK